MCAMVVFPWLFFAIVVFFWLNAAMAHLPCHAFIRTCARNLTPMDFLPRRRALMDCMSMSIIVVLPHLHQATMHSGLVSIGLIIGLQIALEIVHDIGIQFLLSSLIFVCVFVSRTSTKWVLGSTSSKTWPLQITWASDWIAKEQQRRTN